MSNGKLRLFRIDLDAGYWFTVFARDPRNAFDVLWSTHYSCDMTESEFRLLVKLIETIPDDHEITVLYSEENQTVTKTAAEWCDGEENPGPFTSNTYPD